MREAVRYEEMEKALLRLVPAALSESAQAEMEARLDELAGDAGVIRHDFPRWAKWLGGIAAAVTIGVFAFPFGNQESAPLVGIAEDDGMVVITELDRVENVLDEGLFVDAGGSAVRKMSVRVVGESRILDEETGIEVTLTEPRREMVLLPVSTF
jgi:hypothetical protein